MRPKSVSARLAAIRDWPQRAAKAGYSPALLARQLAVEPKALRRFFRAAFGRSVHRQLTVFRWGEAEDMARHGAQAKAIAVDLHFKHLSHFSRQFRQAHQGISFRAWLKAQPPRHRHL